MRIHRSILAAALVLASASAFATTGAEADGGSGTKAGMGPGMGAGMGACGHMQGSKMTPEARRTHADAMFKMMDANADGTITRAEFDQHHQAMMKQAPKVDDSQAGHEQHK